MCGTARLLGLAALIIGGTATAEITSAPEFGAGREQPDGQQQTTGQQPTTQDRAAYKEEAKQRISAWRAKINDFADRASAGSATAGGQANARVTYAWRQVNDSWQQLQAADWSQWAQAQRELEQALQKLEQAWDARQPEPEAVAPQAGRDDERPFFYAIDIATRMLT
jgi:hypothetical protein